MTVVEPLPPATPALALVGENAYVQTVASACVTVTVRPATVRLPVRSAPVLPWTL